MPFPAWPLAIPDRLHLDWPPRELGTGTLMVPTLCRLALLTLAALALGAPTARATVADRFVPFFDAADGVTTGVDSRGQQFVRFGPNAAKLYRKIGGKKARVACTSIIARPNGQTPLSGGYSAIDLALPRKRARIYPHNLGSPRPLDVCAISTKRVRPEYPCLPIGAGETARCARVVVAFSDLGRAYLDAHSRAIEIDLIRSELPFVLGQSGEPPLDQLHRGIGRDIVALAAPGAPPPAGNVGLWLEGENYAISALLADGRLLFARFQDGVYSTNVYELIQKEEPDHAIFTVFY